jgi:hypothetical protein
MEAHHSINTTHAMKITFALRIRDGEIERRLAEPQLVGQGAPLRARLDGQDGYGYVTFQEAGQAEVEIEDELGSLLPELCADSIPELLAGRAVSVRFYRYFGGVELTPEGDAIRISLGGAELARYPRVALLPALLACGERHLDLQTRRYGDLGSLEESFGDLQASLAAARAALAQACPIAPR